MWTNVGFGGSLSRRSVQAAFRPAGGSFGSAQTLSNADTEERLHTNSRVQAVFRPPGGHFGPL